MKSYIGALDQGTTSTRFMVFDHAARIVAVAQKEHQQIFPKSGWVEHDALEILRRTQEVIGEALARRGLRPADLAARLIVSTSRNTAERRALYHTIFCSRGPILSHKKNFEVRALSI